MNKGTLLMVVALTSCFLSGMRIGAWYEHFSYPRAAHENVAGSARHFMPGHADTETDRSGTP